MRYAALLRGVNVGGRTAVPMAALKAELERLGLTEVRTHLNSGNALFASDLSEAALEGMIERALEARFVLPIPALVRSGAELREVIENLPFSAEEIARAKTAAGGAASLYAAFLSMPPDADAIERLAALKKPGEAIALAGRILYLLLDHSIRECRMFSAFDRLDSRATVRNWNTVLKLAALIEA